jgi:hypothetical protein
MAARNPTTPKGGLSNAEKVRIRDEAIDKIRPLLAEKRMCVADIASHLGLAEGTTYGYLRFMAELGEARRSGEIDEGNRHLWELGREEFDGEDPDPQRHGAWIAPARQMGMWRDPLVAALFGPARGVAA